MELQHIQTGFSNFYMTNYSLFLVESHFDGSSDFLDMLHFHLKTFCLFHKLEFHVAAFFSQHAVSDCMLAAIVYGSAVEQRDPLSFIWSTGHTALDWLNLKSFTEFSRGALEDFCSRDGMRNKSAAFFCLLFLVPWTSTGSVLHLRGGLGQQDGGCIMS